jgi:hypothetical protein
LHSKNNKKCIKGQKGGFEFMFEGKKLQENNTLQFNYSQGNKSFTVLYIEINRIDNDNVIVKYNNENTKNMSIENFKNQLNELINTFNLNYTLLNNKPTKFDELIKNNTKNNTIINQSNQQKLVKNIIEYIKIRI